jgi:hypothetical protein
VAADEAVLNIAHKKKKISEELLLAVHEKSSEELPLAVPERMNVELLLAPSERIWE